MNHLWQSSAFAILAALLAFALRNSPAKVRYWVWLSASIKFLVPLSVLVSLGSTVPAPVTRMASIAPAILQVAEPFTPLLYSGPTEPSTDWLPAAIGIAWALGFITIAYTRCRSWLRIRAALRATTRIDLPVAIPAVVAPHATEPGVVGFIRPVLLLPARLIEQLNPEQLDAVLTHEMCHVRRRDNLFAALHMLVEVIFWFHPFVWWIGSRLVEERERACDEEVVRLGCQPSDYVEGILHVCRLYKESPLPCVSGVTGADVKKRLRAILSGNVACEWDMRKKIALMAAGLAALAVPVAIGMLNAAPVSAKFEAASVKPSGPRDPNYFSVSFTGGPGTKDPTLFRCVNFSLAGLVAQAYSLTDVQVKAPQWMHDQLFDISAKVPEGATREEFRTMLQNLLADRFGLAVHHESKERSIYNLVVAEGGPKMKKAAEDADARPKPPLPKGRVGRFRAKETMASFTAYLTNFTGTFVHDATGLNGEYETNFTWIQEETGSLERALQEQLGLKLVATKAPVDYLVVDHAEKSPAEN